MTASKEEIESWTEVFSLFDADGNGKISADELQLGLESLGTKKRQQSILGMIDSVDVDGDRQLDIGEFINLVQTKELDMIFEGDQRLELKREQLIVGLGNIYGQTPTPEETEDYVKAGLELLQKELGAIGNDQKEGYNEALEKCPHLIDDNFLLMFLRTEVFHAERAAKRLTAYWDARVKIFGKDKAFMCLTLDGALKDDTTALSIGFVCPTGESDSCGRGVLFLDCSKGYKTKNNMMSTVRAVWYAVHLALVDEHAQKQGMVVLTKPPDSLKQSNHTLEKTLADYGNGVLPIRLGCFHVCHPPRHLNIMLKIVKVFLPQKLRNRIRVHSGTPEDVLNSLAKYGIPKTAIPEIWEGEFKVESWLEDLRLSENGGK